MKQTKTIAFLLALCTIFFCFASCNKEKGGETEETTTVESTTAADASTPVEEEGLVLAQNSQTKYILIYPNRPNETIKGAIETITGVFKLYFDIDLVAESENLHASAPGEYEILLGDINRPESKQAMQDMKYSDYKIQSVGKKMVIVAGTESGLQKAANAFVTKTMAALSSKDMKRTVTIAEDYLLEERGKYPLEKITVDGVDISKFVLVNDRNAFEENNSLVLSLQNTIGLACGVNLKIVNDRAAEAEHEILVGETVRASTKDYYQTFPDAMEYKFRIQDGDLQILMGSIYTAKDVLKLISQKIQQANGSFDFNILKDVHYTEPISEKITARYEGTNVRIMTNNVLTTGTQPGGERVKLLSKIYHEYLPDFLCLQEFVPEWYELLPKRIADEYVLLDAAPDGKSVQENANPIFYRKDKYEVLEKKCFTTIPKWDDDELTYGVFRDLANGKIYIVFSLHWLVDTRASSPEEADYYRQASAAVILQTVDELKATYNTEYAFVGGDFNAREYTQSYKDLAEGLNDSKYIAEIRANLTSCTSHIFGQPPKPLEENTYRNYDYIFVNGDATRVMTHDIISNDYAINSSDHCPVYIDVILK